MADDIAYERPTFQKKTTLIVDKKAINYGHPVYHQKAWIRVVFGYNGASARGGGLGLRKTHFAHSWSIGVRSGRRARGLAKKGAFLNQKRKGGTL